MKYRIKSLITVLLVLLIFLFLINVVYAPSYPPETNDTNTLYVTVIELIGSPETGMETAITNAKVTLASGSIDGEQSIPAEWQDVPVSGSGQAIFSNVQPGAYTITAKSSGYISTQKEFIKQSGVPGYVSVALTKAPEGTTGSIKIALLKEYAPQTKEYIKNGRVEILKDGKVVKSSGTENGEILFSGLPIGTYIASASAPQYTSKQVEFEIEANVEGWLPVGLEEAIGKPRYTVCPKDCTCDEQTNIIECHGQGFAEKGVAVSTEGAIKIVKDNDVIDEVDDIKLKEDGEKVSYEISGTKSSKLLFFIPVQIDITTVLNAKTGVIENIQKPWWSFLAW